MKIYTRLFVLLLVVVTSIGCSTKKNTLLSRSFHNLTAHYNVYFNGYESYNRAMVKVEEAQVDDYTRTLPVLTYSDDQIPSLVAGDMTRVIEKSEKTIKNHSITVKPKRKRKGGFSLQSKASRDKFMSRNEYCNWIDDAYLLMSKAYFYQHQHDKAQKQLDFLYKNFDYEPKTKQQATLWLARNYIEQKNFTEAKKMINTLENQKFKGFSLSQRRLKRDVALTIAHFYVQQQKYADAIEPLENVIDLTWKRRKKARYKFILAQIYQNQNDLNKASKMYAEVIRMNPPYDMAFNAKINLATAYQSGNSAFIRKQLNKMLRDEKNTDFQDQIYYALAQIAVKDKDLDTALYFYKKSAQTSVNNPNQKGLSYLAVADIYFARPDYTLSGMYYDSTMTSLSRDYEHYADVENKTKNLSELIVSLKTISHEDSLQRIAKMDSTKRKDFVNKLIDNYKRAQQDSIQKAQQAMNDAQQAINDVNRDNKGNVSKFIFYNSAAMSISKAEFRKIWGNRRLEDNWRRSNKSVVMGNNDNDNDDEDKDSTLKELDPTMPEYYTRHLPLTDTLMKKSENKVIDAMFSASDVYRTKLNDYPEAIEMLENLNYRYPKHDHLLQAYYYLYLLYRETGDNTKADVYKNLIINNFPNSKYAQMFSNPNYFAELQKNKQTIEQLYTNAYSSYQKDEFSSVIAYCNDANTRFPGNDLAPNFLFLQSVAKGKIGDTQQMTTGLTQLINEYPQSPLKTTAQNILDGMGKQQQQQVEKKRDEILADSLYKYQENVVHYAVIAINQPTTSLDRVKYEIYNFNADQFKSNTFEITSGSIDTYQCIVVKPLDTKQQADNYLKAIAATKFITEITDKKELFIISADNYATLESNRKFDLYLMFFKKHYK